MRRENDRAKGPTNRQWGVSWPSKPSICMYVPSLFVNHDGRSIAQALRHHRLTVFLLATSVKGELKSSCSQLWLKENWKWSEWDKGKDGNHRTATLSLQLRRVPTAQHEQEPASSVPCVVVLHQDENRLLARLHEYSCSTVQYYCSTQVQVRCRLITPS
jgi:hypothetical protein